MGSMGRPSMSQASHGARPTYSAPKATGHREATWRRILFGASLIRLPSEVTQPPALSADITLIITPKPPAPDSQTPPGSRPQPPFLRTRPRHCPPQNREVFALGSVPGAGDKGLLGCTHAPSVSHLQLHPIIVLSLTVLTSIFIRPAGKTKRKESQAGREPTGLQYPQMPTRSRNEIAANWAQPASLRQPPRATRGWFL